MESLQKRRLLDDELIADVLAVDFTTPVFSRRRTALARLVPETAPNADVLRSGLIAALKTAKDPSALELLGNLTDAQRTAESHRRAARSYLDACTRAAGQLDAVVGWLSVASQRRLELVRADTARHPEGNIKEEGFRRIFPVDNLTPNVGALRLDPVTCRAVAAP